MTLLELSGEYRASAAALRAAIIRFQASGEPGSALVRLVPGAGAPAF